MESFSVESYCGYLVFVFRFWFNEESSDCLRKSALVGLIRLMYVAWSIKLRD